MARTGHRIGLVGATGSLGGEVLADLDASSLRIASLRPIATDRSLGTDVEFQGEICPVETELSGLAGLDAVMLCAPPAASLEGVREALRAEVLCIDCSGALLDAEEVPVWSTWLPEAPGIRSAPLFCSPPGPALAWSAVLAPLHERARIRSVTGTALEAASASGRVAIETLYAESLCLFNQEEPPEPAEIGQPLAFDCLPTLGEPGAEGQTPYEWMLSQSLRRLLVDDLTVRVTAAHVPAFMGHAASLVIETESPIDAKEAREILGQAAGVEVWDHDARGPNLRAAASRETTLVGRLRGDGSSGGLQLWLAADLLRLAGHNAVALLAGLLAERSGDA